MNLHFLPQNITSALNNLNTNFLSEIRIRKGQAVIIEYFGEYKYINSLGVCNDGKSGIVANDIESILINATGGSIYAYAEQLKKGFITLDGGIRIGVAGEYVCDGEKVIAVRQITSLNIRIPHDVQGCALKIYDTALKDGIKNVMIFSPVGYGKTTILRDLTKIIAKNNNLNILVFDERNEIAAFDGENFAYKLGDRVDVVRGGGKLQSFENAIRAMKPQLIVCDELYGEKDITAINFAVTCGINVIATSHVQDKKLLQKMPFDIFAELTGIGKQPIIYDKDFNIVCDNNSDNNAGLLSFDK
jgi:stage III sporulation protein AA